MHDEAGDDGAGGLKLAGGLRLAIRLKLAVEVEVEVVLVAVVAGAVDVVLVVALDVWPVVEIAVAVRPAVAVMVVLGLAVEVVVVVAVLRRCTMISQDDLEAARREQESADECLDLAKKKTDDAARIHEQMESFLIQADLARKAATEFQQKVDDCLRQVGSARTLFEETMLEADRLRSEAAALIRSALARLDGKKKQSCST